MDDRDPVLVALRLLADRARTLAERHPWRGPQGVRTGELELTLRIPLGDAPEWLHDESQKAAAAIEQGVRDLLADASAFDPGRVLCLRCRSTECDDARPPAPRDVFAGYGPTGVPRYQDFAQLLLNCQDPRVEMLYDEGSDALVALIQKEADLTADLLDAFRDRERGYRIHGQICAGWYRIRNGREHSGPFALTFQVVSSRPGTRGRRYGVNVLGEGPGGESLEHLHDRITALPWTGALRWAQAVLDKIERDDHARAAPATIARRIDGLLTGFARRLERGERARGRRTAHAEDRHREGTRPTRMAVLDLERASPDELLIDVRAGTFVVLGERGRAHVFNESGKLVTSVRYPPQTIERRRRSGLWRVASPEEAARLRSADSRN